MNIVQCPGSLKFSNRRKRQAGKEVHGPETRKSRELHPWIQNAELQIFGESEQKKVAAIVLADPGGNLC